jgi:hypothetical protein
VSGKFPHLPSSKNNSLQARFPNFAFSQMAQNLLIYSNLKFSQQWQQQYPAVNVSANLPPFANS